MDEERLRPPHVPRRVMLLGLAGAVVGAVTVGREIASSDDHGTVQASARGALAAATSHTAPRPAPPVISTGVHWANRWKAPIYDLDDFLKRSHGLHFPRRSVLLTVDDGPHPVWTPRYLRLFAKHHVTATFNLIGEQVMPNRRIVRATATEGHVLANHTWTHDEGLPYRSRRDIRREIARTNEVIHDVTGRRPTQFRAPGGVWGPKVFDEVRRHDMLPVGWNIDPRDWARPGTPAIERAMLASRPGDIILCHDGGGDRSQTFQALQKVIPALKHRGFTFVALP